MLFFIFSRLFQPALVVACLLLAAAGSLRAQMTDGSLPDPLQVLQAPGPVVAPPPPGQVPAPESKKTKEQKAEEQLKIQEHQRIFGILPYFNVIQTPDVVALNPKQKLLLSLKGATDPIQFVVAAADAGISQAQDDYHGYGQGAQGYFKRWGAAYADSFDGAFFGGAIFPILLHQDPRYFRKGTGSFSSRLYYSLLTTVRAKNDDGEWRPNYSNVLGNIAAGGIANLYYPSSDRGAGLTFERAFTVTAEGAVGGVLLEFWPDIQRIVRRKH